MVTFFGVANTTVQLATADHLRGRVMSLYTLAFGGLTPLGSLLAGALAQWIKTPLTFALCGLLCALMFAGALRSRARHAPAAR